MELGRSLKTHALALALVLCATQLFSSPRALAQDATYRRLAEDATRAMSDRRLSDALTLFREMHALSPSARTLWSLGRVHYEMGQYVIAMDYLGQALADERRALDASQRSEAEALSTRAEAITGTLVLTVDSFEGALIVDDVQLPVLDGAALDEAPPRVVGMVRRAVNVRVDAGVRTTSLSLTLRLDPGDHTVRVEPGAGRAPSVRRVPIRSSETVTVHIDTTPTSSAVGGLGAVSTAPGGAIPILGHLSPDVRVVLTSAPSSAEGRLTLFLEPMATAGTIAAVGAPVRLCDAPCEVRHRRGMYAAAISRDGGEPAEVHVQIPLTTDSQLMLNYHDESGTRIAGGVVTALIVGFGVVATILGSVALAVDRDDAFREVIGSDGAAVLLGTGIPAALLGLLGLGFALSPDWGEVNVVPIVR